MVDKTSYDECVAANVNVILNWSKNRMSVIKSIEKIYLMKSVGIPEHYLCGNADFLVDSWKNQGL